MNKWYRSSQDKVMMGLIGGLANKMGWDASLLRVLFVISIFVTSGTSLLIYFIASLFVPQDYKF